MGERTARSLRPVLTGGGVSVMPGGCTPLAAMIAERAGFESFFVAGSQVSAVLYGVPDVGLIGMRDMATHAAQIARASDIALLVDGDTGYGNAVGVHYAVEEFIASGAAGVQFEDQEAPKKSGTGSGRRVIPITEAVGKYRAAVAARDRLNPEFVICARTDAIGAEGSSFADALDRCRAYEDAGVDAVWLNSPESLDQIGQACAALSVPVITTWARPGAIPSLDDFAGLGLTILLVPTIASTSGSAAAWRVLHDLRSRGTAALEEWRGEARIGGWTPEVFSDLLGNPTVRQVEAEFLPASSQRDYDSTSGSMTPPA